MSSLGLATARIAFHDLADRNHRDSCIALKNIHGQDPTT